MKKVYLIAVIFALVAGFATYFFASEIDKKTTIKDADTIEVIVPVNDISQNSTITEEMFAEDAGVFTKKTVVAADVNAQNVATSNEQLLGKVTVDPLYAGEPINVNRVEDINGADVALSLKLKKGKVAYSFSAGSVTSVDGYINEGDKVDVLVYDGDKGKARVAYKNLPIMRVSTATASKNASASGVALTEYSTLTVEVTEKQALALYKIENESTFKLVLKHRNNAPVPTTKPADAQ
ncbi:MAG: Flp pilus assembly protein CpaB [Eubacterium coprostanoligenes]|uniref:Flp pilus assembly protein CpaB n=1 Tax=Eubacterium coprostanoligenes TaxID=290054 RepID=UPI002409A0C2|nr:Flp pilus assembly protein CpaB [Eubacterium coprostanoligenes]MDD6665524.1 Flp pilus assembly protein CpaB [Eubacterium coprostanoligenes]